MQYFCFSLLCFQQHANPMTRHLGCGVRENSATPFQCLTNGPSAPANDAVEYIPKHHFRAALFNLTEYMGYPTEDGRTDQLWSDLYNCE